MSIKIEIPISRTEISKKLKELISNIWMLRWTTSKEYKHSKNFLDKPNPNLAKKILQLPRLKMKRLVEIITGHNNHVPDPLGIICPDPFSASTCHDTMASSLPRAYPYT